MSAAQVDELRQAATEVVENWHKQRLPVKLKIEQGLLDAYMRTASGVSVARSGE